MPAEALHPNAIDCGPIKRRFDSQGFVLLEGFFDNGLMTRLDRVIRRHYGEQPADWHSDEFITRSQTDVVPWFPQREPRCAPLFTELSQDGPLTALTTALIGARWTSLDAMAMFSRDASPGQAWHQDCPPEQPRRFNFNRLIYGASIDPAIGGAVVVMPGSHRKGIIPAGEPHEDLPGQVELRPGKGDLLMLHGHCWHRVLPVSGGQRYSINYRAAPEGVPGDVTDVCVYRNMRYRFSTAELVEERTPT